MTCEIENCDRPIKAKGYCNMHYGRQLHGWPMDAPARRSRAGTCDIGGCSRPICYRGMCKTHYERTLRGAPLEVPIGPSNKVRTGYTKNGYRFVRDDSGRQVGEHRLVMEGILGRRLLPGENVHHRNGARADNRPANLELWVSKQPKGQRPADLVEWAREIIDRYEDDVNAGKL